MTSSISNSVLFLDIDGVLATERCVTEEYEEGDTSLYHFTQLCPSMTGFVTPLDKSRIRNLKWVIDQIPDLKIVISSTWRLDYTMMTFLTAALMAGGIDANTVVLGGTPQSENCRGNEISAWLTENPEYCHFVIVDDDHMASFSSYGLTDYCVRTEMRGAESAQGLCPEAATKVVQLLNHQRSSMSSLASASMSAPCVTVQGPKLVFLCGVPGIGKDSLCDYVLQHFPWEFQHYVCFSQDQFAEKYGSRKGVECQSAVEAALASGYSVILKRNNHMVRDRQAFVDIAWNLGVTTAAVFPHELCGNKSVSLLQMACRNALSRVQPGGEGHETLRDSRVIPGVCSSFFKNFEAPTLQEVHSIHSISYLNVSTQHEHVTVYPSSDHSSSTKCLSKKELEEYERFIPHSPNPCTGFPETLSFCVPSTKAIQQSQQRSKQEIAEDFVDIMKSIGFV